MIIKRETKQTCSSRTIGCKLERIIRSACAAAVLFAICVLPGCGSSGARGQSAGRQGDDDSSTPTVVSDAAIDAGGDALSLGPDATQVESGSAASSQDAD